MIDNLILKKHIIFIIFIDWLKLEEFAIFDTSLCNHNCRELFLHDLLRTQAIFRELENNNPSVKCVKWLSMRSISVRKINVSMNVLIAMSKTKFGFFDSLKPFQYLNTASIHFYSEFSSCMGYQILQAAASHLTYLVLNNSPYVDDCVVSKIADCCHNLTAFNFQKTSISHVSLAKLIDSNKNVKVVECDRTQIADCSVSTALSICKDIERLTFSFCRSMPTESINLLGKCESLTTFHLRACCLITLESIQTVVRGCINLTDLDVGYCGHIICDKFLIFISKYAQQIKKLYIDNNPGQQITDVGMLELCNTCKFIESLDISKSSGLTFEGILSISFELRNLQRIVFSGLTHLDCNKVFVAFGSMFEPLLVLDTINTVLCGKPRSCERLDIQKLVCIRLAMFPGMSTHEIKFRNQLLTAVIKIITKGSTLKEVLLERNSLANTLTDEIQNLFFGNMSFHRLEKLHFKGASFGREMIMSAAVYSGNLLGVVFVNLPDLADSFTQAIIYRNQHTLQEFRCIACGMITDVTVQYLIAFCRTTLQILEIRECETTFDSVANVLAKCTRLTELVFSFVGNIPHVIASEDGRVVSFNELVLGMSKQLNVCEVYRTKRH